MRGEMDQLAQDLASGKLVVEAEKKEDKPKVVNETSRLALLMKKHEEQVRINNRAAQEAMALKKHHRFHGEHELADVCSELAHTYHKASALHARLHQHYSSRHGEGSKKK